MADQTQFAHLHLHTHYSLLDGFNRIGPLVKQTKELGMTACAVTDHGNLYAAIEFYTECQKVGINPILGYEAYLAPGHRGDKKAGVGGGGKGDAYSHLTLLAKNRTGFQNLVKLSSIAFLEGFYYHPRIDREVLAAHSEGLVCLSGCLAGEFNQHILRDDRKAAEKLAGWFAKTFKEDFYVELQNNGLDIQDRCTPVAVEIAGKLGVPLVATADAHYLCQQDAEAHDVLFCINTGKKRNPHKKQYPEGHMPSPYYVRSPKDMYALFPGHEAAVARSQQIADGVDIQLDFKKRHFPVFKCPDGLTPDKYLKQLCLTGIAERYAEPSPAVFARLEHELGVISKMGYAAYFLIVWDFVRYAREEGIPSTARGSGCGSLVAYVLFLSHVCPLEYDLLFERFLDPNRTEPPDIDIDFCQDRRELVIDYVKQKYGRESVAQIGTFGTLAAKAALKDVGRVLDIPLEKVNFMCKLVPMMGAIAKSLPDALKESPDFRREYEQDPTVRQWVDIALKLEGTNRNVGTHAAGVVIADGPITNYVPVQRVMRKSDDQEGGGKTAAEVVVTTQWEMGIIEKVGMLKMDFLGLRNLTVLDETVKLIKRTRGVDVDPLKFPLDDVETYKLLQRGDAKGVFQLESDGIRELLKQMKPDTIRDLIAVLALYRPGPLKGGMVDSYVNRKHGREKWEDAHPVMTDVLAETYGVMVYQEQIMRILNRLGGIELSKAYACIKAISKKITEKIDAFRADFLAGCKTNGVDKATAEDIFEKIVFFAGYGFNKCVCSDTLVPDALTGERVTVGELFRTRRPTTVHALGDDGKLGPRPVTDVVWNGRKPVFRLTTELGHRIVATANHPFRTLDGWTNLGELAVGDRIAAPRRLSVPTTDTWPAHELVTLAGLLSEGNTCHPGTLYFYGNGRELVDDFAAAIGRFPDTVSRVYARPDGKRLEVAANTGRRVKREAGGGVAVAAPPARSGAYRWAERLGVTGRKATAKRVPAEIFRLCDADLELFLGRLWAGDGFIANEALKVPFYATSSEGLAGDVQHLLVRLGLVSRIHRKVFKYRGGTHPGFTVHLLGDGAAETFLARIAPHCLGREPAVGLLREHVASTARGRTSKDTVPLGVRAWVDDERRRLGLTWDALEAASDVSMQEFYGTPSPTKTGFRRATIAKLASFFGSARLAAVADSDVFWDRVVSVEPLGEQDTFDLTVEGDHNFVADGLVVHNSHTAAYAQIGYQTAYLKAHYPAEFMAALLSSEIDDGNKRDVMVEHIADARKLGVEVQPPDVNKGQPGFDVVNGKIVFGLTAIKGLGRGAAEEIVKARDTGGPFRDLFDFCERVDLRAVPRAGIERLIKAGAMDAFGKDKRAAMTLTLPRAAQAAEDKAADKRRGQASFFDGFDAPDDAAPNGFKAGEGLSDCPEWADADKLRFEKEALDFYISSHPLARSDEQLRLFRSHDAAGVAKLDAGVEVRLGGIVTQFDTRVVKAGRNQGARFALFRLEDLSGQVKCVLWSDQFARFKDDVAEDKVVLLDGKVEWRDGSSEAELIVSKAMTLDRAKLELTKGLLLRLTYDEDEEHLRKLDGLAHVLKRHRGGCPVWLEVRDPAGRKASLRAGQDYWVDAARVPVGELEMLLGQGAVLFTGK